MVDISLLHSARGSLGRRKAVDGECRTGEVLATLKAVLLSAVNSVCHTLKRHTEGKRESILAGRRARNKSYFNRVVINSDYGEKINSPIVCPKN
jgi:hypothetical protein